MVETDSKVVVEVRTDETGQLVSVRAISGPVELGPDAERQARRRLYEAGKLNGVAVGVISTVTFRYAPGTAIAPFEKATDTPRQ